MTTPSQKSDHLGFAINKLDVWDDCPGSFKRLIEALMKCREQRNTAYVCSWDKDLGSMIVDDDAELIAILEGKHNPK